MSDEPRDEPLSRLYRESDRAEPPPALDEAILAVARAAVAPAPRRRPGWRAWMLPMSLAATVAMTVSLTLMVQREQERVGEGTSPTTAVPSKPAEAEAATPIVRQEKAAATIEKKTAVPPSGLKEEAQIEAKPLAKPSAEAPAAPAVAGSPSLAAPTPALPAADALESRARAAAPLPREAARAAVARTPEQWLEEIRQLKSQGKEREAAESLTAFRHAYPDYRLPEDLR